MRFSVRLSLFLTLASSLPLVSAVPQHEDQAYTFSPSGRSATADTDPALEVRQETQRTPSAWTRLRDSLVESVWGLPRRSEGCESRPRNRAKTVSRAPATLQARYGEDVVLRFTIKNQEEVKALVEASNILFLDVWGSHDDWVDIRLSRDVVCFSICECNDILILTGYRSHRYLGCSLRLYKPLTSL